MGRRAPDDAAQPGPLARRGLPVHPGLAPAQRQRRGDRPGARSPRWRTSPRTAFRDALDRHPAPRRPLPVRTRDRPPRPRPRPRADEPLRDPGDLAAPAQRRWSVRRRRRGGQGPVLVHPGRRARAVHRPDRDPPREGPGDRRQERHRRGDRHAVPHPQGQPGRRRPGLRRRRPRLAGLPAALPARTRVHGSGPGHRPPARPGRLGGQRARDLLQARISRRPVTAAPRSTRSPTSPSSPRRRP